MRARFGAYLPAATFCFVERRHACAGFCLSRTLRHGCAIVRRDGRSLLRYDCGEAADSGVLPRALYERFNIEVLATTDSPLDPLNDHEAIRESGWKARIVPTFRPDSVVDPDLQDPREHRKLGVQNGEDSTTWLGYLEALRKARARFRSLAARPPIMDTHCANRDLDARQAEELFHRVLAVMAMRNSMSSSARKC